MSLYDHTNHASWDGNTVVSADVFRLKSPLASFLNQNVLYFAIGEYLALTDDEEVELLGVPSREVDRQFIVQDIKKSLKSPNGFWSKRIPEEREKIEDILENEPNSARANRLKELGLHQQLNNAEFVEKLVKWEEFCPQRMVKFVRYDEAMYDFIKDGLTNRDMVKRSMILVKPVPKHLTGMMS